MSDKLVIKKSLRPIQYIDGNGELKTIDPKEILTFDKYDLDFSTQANHYFLIARLLDLRQREYDDTKLKLDTLYAQLYALYIKDKGLRADNNNRKPSEAMLSSAVMNDMNYINLSEKLNSLSADVNLLKRFLKAIELKMNMMQSESAMQRVDFTKRG